MTALVICTFIVAVILGYATIIYNGLVRVRNEVKLAWSNIDVLLVQRHDELPKLIEVCKGYMQHERETLESVARARTNVDGARSAGNIPSVSVAEGALRSRLSSLFAVAERYPDLKANDLFRNLQTRISALETAIADRREIYNDAVNAQNVRLEAFPDMLIARPFHFLPADMLKFSAEETSDIDLKPAFGG
ncbi:MAG TPA: LemA family protein [Steroidobacteraceae bacterium]|nr:LemA family protein [Steroidobacteraceae bacterium]